MRTRRLMQHSGAHTLPHGGAHQGVRHDVHVLAITSTRDFFSWRCPTWLHPGPAGDGRAGVVAREDVGRSLKDPEAENQTSMTGPVPPRRSRRSSPACGSLSCHVRARNRRRGNEPRKKRPAAQWSTTCGCRPTRRRARRWMSVPRLRARRGYRGPAPPSRRSSAILRVGPLDCRGCGLLNLTSLLFRMRLMYS